MPGQFLVGVLACLYPERAAALGTAGFTAMIATLKLADAGFVLDSGDVLVTSTTGAVGSIAISLLTARGAAEVINRGAVSLGSGAPPQSRRWAAAVDCRWRCHAGTDLPTTVLPSILPNVT